MPLPLGIWLFRCFPCEIVSRVHLCPATEPLVSPLRVIAPLQRVQCRHWSLGICQCQTLLCRHPRNLRPLCEVDHSDFNSFFPATVLLYNEKKPNPCTHQDPLSSVPEILGGKIAQTCSFLTGPNKVRPKLSMQLSGGG